MFAMPNPYPKKFRDDVVRVALNREPGVRIKDIAEDFGITESCLGSWLARARDRSAPDSSSIWRDGAVAVRSRSGPWRC
jgi:transposase-like protein